MRNLIAILPIIVSSACSFSNNQIHDGGAFSSENTTILSNHVKSGAINNGTNKRNIIHTAMSPVESRTSLTTMKQQLRADPLWNALANEVVYGVQGLSEESKELKQRSIYIARLENPSTELKAFRSLIMTKLVQNGFNITFSPNNAYYLKYDILNKDSDQPSNESLVVRVAVISGEKVMTSTRELSALTSFEKQKEILRVVRNQ